MDAVKKLNQNFLSCNICTERFNDPCTLGCGHTFCKACLGEYTKTRQDAIAAKSILCPNCRQMTKVPNPDKRVEDWLKQMKPHFLIRGLLDEFTAAGVTAEAVPEPPDRHCYPCHQIGKATQAGCLCQDCNITLCRDCVKMHQTMPATNTHTITVLQDKIMGRSERKTVCKEHGSVVEFICEQCRKMACSKCLIKYHGQCESVVTIDSVVPDMVSAVKHNQSKILHAVKDLKENITLQQSILKTVEENKHSLQSKIRRVSQQTRELIKQKEKQLMDELDEFTEKQSGQLKGLIKSGQIDLQKYQRYSEFMDQALRSGSQTDLYNMYQMCQSGEVKCAVDRVTDGSVLSSLGTITFVDKLDLEALDRHCVLGSVKLSYENDDKAMNPSAPSDVHTSCNPADVTVLDVHGVRTVVVTDDVNNCIKSFYTRKGEVCNSTKGLRHTPYTISRLTDNQVVVSFNSLNAFMKVYVLPHISSDKLTFTKKKYSCLTALSSDTLAAGCMDPVGIDILDLSGSVLRSVTSTGHGLAGIPVYLCVTNKGHIIVSDYNSQSIYCLTLEGDVVFTYKPEKHCVFNGVTTTPSGDILVVDWVNNKVIQLTERGDFVRDILTSQDGIAKPYGISLCQNTMYITEFHKDCVRVFRL